MVSVSLFLHLLTLVLYKYTNVTQQWSAALHSLLFSCAGSNNSSSSTSFLVIVWAACEPVLGIIEEVLFRGDVAGCQVIVLFWYHVGLHTAEMYITANALLKDKLMFFLFENKMQKCIWSKKEYTVFYMSPIFGGFMVLVMVRIWPHLSNPNHVTIQHIKPWLIE